MVTKPPLFVDLDGTLTYTDTLIEGLCALIKHQPAKIFLLPWWLRRGKAYFKSKIASATPFSAAQLPYNQSFLSFLKAEKAKGRKLFLITGANQAIAEQVSDHLELFEQSFASCNKVNMVGQEKVQLIKDVLNDQSPRFSYAGNSHSDLSIWKEATEAIVVNAPRSVINKLDPNQHITTVFYNHESKIKSFFKGIRLYQWVKNLLLFTALFATPGQGTWQDIFYLSLSFFSFSLCASAIYLFNDLMDLSSDRRHPVKQNRPIASGSFPLSLALCLTPILLAAGTSLAYFVSSKFLGMILLYVVITLLYSLKLKQILLLDVLILSALYNWRILSGAIAIDSPLSPWLLGFGCFIFFSLALAKRATEIIMLQQRKEKNALGRGYSHQDQFIISQLGVTSGLSAVVVLALYINSQMSNQHFEHPHYLWLICLATLYWISRIWVITGRGQMHHDPIVYTIKDKHSYIVGLLIALVTMLASGYLSM